MFKMFPDNHVQNNHYKVLFGQGEWTCSITIFTGTHKGSMMGPGGKRIGRKSKRIEDVDETILALNKYDLKLISGIR